MATVSEGVTLIRDRLNESTAAHWTDNQLKLWLGEGCRDLARRSLCILDRFTITLSSGTREYTLSSSLTIANLMSGVTGITADFALRIDRAEFIPDSTRNIELVPYDYDSMSALWGAYQDSSDGFPYCFTTWGNPPFLTIRLYPGPSATSTLRLFVRRLPRTIATSDTTQVIDLPSGYEDIACDYAAYRACQNDHDPQWQTFFNSYEARVRDAIDSIDDYTRAQQGIVPDGVYGAPAWLVNDGPWGWGY